MDRLWINHHGGPVPHLFTRAQQVTLIPEADVAVVTADAPESRWVQPFRSVQYAVSLGEPVCAFGYPEDLLGDVPAKETPRFFRGNVQRPFLFQKPGARGYSAYELNFPCPPGLSGGPVFLAEEPFTVIGVVTENFESYTIRYAEEEERHKGKTFRVEARQVITYGVAANLLAAADVLEKVLGKPLPNRLSG